MALTWIILAVRGALGSPLMLALVTATGVFTLFSGSLASQTVFWLYSTLAVAMLAAARRGRRRADAATVEPATATSPAAATSPAVT